MESISLDSDSHHTQQSSSSSLSSSSPLSSDSSGSGTGEWDMCGRQHDRLAPSHDPVVMDGLSRRGDAPDKPGSWHEGNAIHLVGGE